MFSEASVTPKPKEYKILQRKKFKGEKWKLIQRAPTWEPAENFPTDSESDDDDDDENKDTNTNKDIATVTVANKNKRKRGSKK